MDNFHYFLQSVISNRQASWPIAGIVWCLVCFTLRDLFLGMLFSRIRELDKPLRRDVKKAYFGHAFWGWMYFLLSLVFFLLFWRFSRFELLNKGDFLVLAGALVFSQLFALSHLQAVGLALLSVLKQTPRLEHHSAAV